MRLGPLTYKHCFTIAFNGLAFQSCTREMLLLQPSDVCCVQCAQ